MRFFKRNSLALAAAVLVVPAFFMDKEIILRIRNFYAGHPDISAFVRSVEPFAHFISNGGTLIGAAVFLFLFAKFYRQGLYRPARTLLIGLIASGIFVQIPKHLIGRARPRITHDTVFMGPTFKSGYDSFPSGHTTTAFCFALIVSWYWPKYRVPAYIFALLVGLDRMQGFNHFTSDVLGGVVVGALAGRFFVDREVGQRQEAQR